MTDTHQTSRRLRTLSLDPFLHRLRRKYARDCVQYWLPRRQPLYKLQPPQATIYLSRTMLAARRLYRSLISIRLQRSLSPSRRPDLSTLVSAGIVPKECCRKMSGEFVLGAGVAGALVERKRRVEREQIKEGLRVWLERKAREITVRKKEGGVGVLVWRFSRRIRLGDSCEDVVRRQEEPKRDRVNGLKRFWEELAS